MKKYILSIIVTSLTLMSCGDSFLEEKPQNFEAPENVYTSTKGFQTAMNGLYALSRLEFATFNETPTSQGTFAYESLQIGLDICVRGFKEDAASKQLEDYTFDPANSYMSARWTWAYGLIANANQMINNAENPGINWKNPQTDKAYFQAQGRFFRAYAYRYLVYLFGDVPWVTEVTDNFRTDFPRTPKDEVIGHMIEDLKFATENLPEDPSSTTIKQGELTRWAAWHLLSEVYLMSKQYDKARDAALNVINSGKYSLVKARFGSQKNNPGDFFADMFLENNQNRPSGNTESIWVVQDEYNKQGAGGRYMDWTRRAWVPYYQRISGFVLSPELGGRGIGQIRPLEWLLDSYETKDIRNSEYNIKRTWVYNDPKSAKYGQVHKITQADIDAGNCFVSTTKFNYGVADVPNYEGNNKDKMRFRLAETYLLLAEAYLGLGNTTEAANAINVVRSRSNATPVVAANVNLDYLLDERARELLGEEVRRFTLARTGTILTRTRTLNPVSKSKIQDHNVLWPIPQTIIDANSGLKWENNPGYN